MRKFLILITPFLLIACSSNKPVEKIEVPVYSQIQIPLPSEPELEIYNLTETSSNIEVLRAYGQTVDQLLIYSKSLVKLIEEHNSK